MAIRMRESKKKDAICCECGIPYKHTRAITEIQIGENRMLICKSCEETLFRKLLLLDCKYNSRLKSSEDIKRSARETEWKRKHEQ